MRWAVLYARSREVPASAAVVVVAVTLLGLPEGDLRLSAFAAAVGVAALALGLGAHDVALDRGAAFGWPPRRAAHLLLGGLFVGGLLLTVGPDVADHAVVWRNVAGLGGLAALGALLFGSRTAWALPVTWTGATLVVPSGDLWFEELLSWPVQPAGTTSATTTALVLGVTGLLAGTARTTRR